LDHNDFHVRQDQAPWSLSTGYASCRAALPTR
jgi:hypothetical protein